MLSDGKPRGGKEVGEGRGRERGKDCTCKEHSLLSEACHKEVFYFTLKILIKDKFPFVNLIEKIHINV